MIHVYLAVCMSLELRNKMNDTLIVAIGSTVMTDDAIGHHILQVLEKRELHADFADLGMDLFKLRLFFKGHKNLIIIDAIRGDYMPGTVLVFSYDEIKDKLEAKTRNIHHIGSIEALEIMRLSDEKLAQAKIQFVGIVVESIDKGLELTRRVQKSIIKAVEMIVDLLENC